MTSITEKHVVEGDYGYVVYCDELGEEVARAGTGLTAQGKISFALDLLQGIYEKGLQDELLTEYYKLKQNPR